MMSLVVKLKKTRLILLEDYLVLLLCLGCPGLKRINDFWFPTWLQELLQTLLCFLRSFRFTLVTLYPLSSQVLYHHRVSMITSRLTSSLRTLWSAVIKSPKYSALGTTVPVRLLHRISGLSGNEQRCCVYSVPLLLAAPKVIHEKNWKHVEVLETFHQPIHPWTPVANPAHLATHHSAIPRRHFLFPRADESSLAFSLLLVAGISVSVTVSCDENVGEVDEVEELVDEPGTTNGTWFDVSQWIFLPFLMKCGFWPLVQW